MAALAVVDGPWGRVGATQKQNSRRRLKTLRMGTSADGMNEFGGLALFLGVPVIFDRKFVLLRALGYEFRNPILSRSKRGNNGRAPFFLKDYLTKWMVRIIPGLMTATLRLSRFRAATVVL